MTVTFDLTLDCTDAQLLAAFWKTALGYVDKPPPPPFRTRGEWLAQFHLPESAGDDAWLVPSPAGWASAGDPEGAGTEDGEEPAAYRHPGASGWGSGCAVGTG
ncbi:VOC family protein [Amycolatopsis sp. FU40]|uniref:VOC family protein n=1 Tax=Amycolatopsis sp. FU40 TaxID=2914159 RepID=UPI002103F379|nr:VOC family protein [Amycolatopsis sp. FU40]